MISFLSASYVPINCQIADEAETFEHLDSYTGDDKHLVSRCAIAAKRKGYTHFALRDKECYSSYNATRQPIYGDYEALKDCWYTAGLGDSKRYNVYELRDEGIYLHFNTTVASKIDR